jgi:hypothetical protein
MSASQTPQAQTIKDSHDGQNAGAPPSVNKVYQVLPKTTYPSQPFNGAGQNVEFCLPNYLGKVIDNVLQFDLEFKDSGAGGSLTVSPSTLFCDRIEHLYDGSVIESQDADQVHMTTLAYLTDQEYNTIRTQVNIGTDGNFQTADPIVVSAGGVVTKKTFYLPIWSGAINSFQPYVRGFNGEWRFRFWMAKSGIVNTYSGVQAGLTITCTNLALWSTEAQLSEGADRNLRNAHKRAINYRGVLQTKFTSQESSVSNTSEYRKTLASFNSDTAGLLVFARPNSALVPDQLTKSPMQYVGFLDAGGSEIVQRLPDSLIRYFVQPDTIPITSDFSAPAVQSFYILPLCANLLNVLETGAVSGGLRLSTQEQIALLPLNTLTNTVITVHAYEYAMLEVSNKSASVVRRA